MIRVRVLGELALERDEVPIESPVGRGARSLLGVLALERRLHPRAQLAARLWPDVQDESARTSLRSALAALRRALEPDAERYLVATRDRVGLSDEVWTDAAAFETHAAAGRLRQAIDLWRGDLLSGQDDERVLAARDEWRERAAAVLGELADEADAAGDRAAGIAYTRRIVALDPLAEDGQRTLIRRLAHAGDRPAALAAYGRYADRLRTELRIAPSAATRALVDELRGAEPERAPAAAASGTVTLLFTDLVGSTELLSALGDDEAERLRRVHFGLLRDVALSHAGEEVKSLGDGLMVAFGSSVDAAGCAIGIQQAVERHNRRTGSERLRVRVGLNVGEPVRDEDDYFGTPVVIAKRLCDRAEGGQILASALVRLLIGARGDFVFRSVGELDLKGLAEPVPACVVEWEASGTETIALPSDLARDEGGLVGRVDELTALEAAWHRARAGRLGVVGVAGEPGIGKTRLVAELARRAHVDGATVLLGRCNEETLAPYEPFVEALRQYVAACPLDELRLQVGTRRRVLARLVPEFDPGEAAAPDRPGDAPAGDVGDRYALFDAVGALLREVADAHPAILVLDDLQWADDASLLLLRHVVRATGDAPLLIVGTYRDTEVLEDDALSSALAQLRRARVLESVSLRGLDAEDVAVLIRERGAELSSELTSAVAERTEGNPFFVEEIIRDAGVGGEVAVPDSVKDLLRRRLRQLGEDTKRTLAAAAVLGRQFDVDVLERMAAADDDDDETLDALDAALSAQVLVDVPDVVGRFAFSHALIRETVYEQVSAARRPGLHQRAGEALQELRAAQPDAHAAQLAQHFAEAGDDARSLDHRVRASRAAARVHALATALAHQSAALDTAGRLGLSPAADERVRRMLLERGWTRWVAGDHEGGVADYDRSLEAARAAGDLRLQAEALDSLAFAEKQFDLDGSGAHHGEALTIAEELADVPLQIRILSRMALTRANQLDLAGAMDAGERARQLASGTGDERDEANAIDALKLAALMLGDLEQLDALTTRLEEIERRHGELWYLQWTLLEASFVPLARARWDRADAKLGEALAINRRVGDTLGGPLIHDAVCWLERSRGGFAAALKEGRLAVELTERAEFAPFGAWTRATLGWTLLDLRAGADAVVVLERGLADASILGDRFRVAGHLAWAHTLAGDRESAERAVDDAERAYAGLRVRDDGAFLFGFGAAANLARAHLAAGRPERGQALVNGLLTSAARSGWHEATALLSLVVGLCCAALPDDGDGARSHLRGAADLAVEHTLPGVGWEALAALAAISPPDEAQRLRAESAAVAARLAAGIGDAELAAGFVRGAQR
jgi:class 3 adenylate cyclase